LLSERKPLHTNVNAELLKKLKLIAVQQDKAINEMLEEILTEYFRTH